MRLPALARTIERPTWVEPVNDTLSTSECSTNAAPTAPSPVTRLITPGGNPTCCASSASRIEVSGVCSGGLMITVLPVARAGASFHPRIISGKFHGVINAHTPTGSRRV